MATFLDDLRREFRPMLRLAWPLVLAEIGWMAMVFVDTIMVGRLPNSATAIGAVSLGGVVFFTVSIFGAGLLLGLDTLVSQAFGARDLDDCHRSLISGVWLALVLAPIFMLLIWLSMPLLRDFKVNLEVLAECLPYVNSLNWSTLPLLLYFAFRRYLQAMNLVAPITFALVSANLVNVLVNWMLIFGHFGAPAMGVAGAGWATTFSRSYMAAVLIGYALWHDRRYNTGLRRASLLPDYGRVGQLLRLGLPAAGQMTIEIGIFALATALIGRLDATELAGHQIALNAASFTFMIPLGVSAAAAVRVGQALGRRDPVGASHAGWAALVLGVAFMACAALSFWLLPRHISRIFTPDESVIAVGVGLLFIAAFFQLFDGIQITITGALRGAGDTRTAMITHLVCYWGIGLPLGYWLCFARGWRAAGLWTGLCVALILIGIVLLFAWTRTVRVLRTQLARPGEAEITDDRVDAGIPTREAGI